MRTKWRNFGRHLMSGTALALVLLWILAIIALSNDLLKRVPALPMPPTEHAVNGIDYWLARYQTLLAGFLAVLTGLFAVWAAAMSIKYDRRKTADAAEQTRRARVKAVLRAMEHAGSLTLTAHWSISCIGGFPNYIPPEAFVDIEAVEKIILENLEYLPSKVASRCLSIVHSLRWSNARLQKFERNPPTGPLSFPQRFKLMRPFLFALEGMLAAIDIMRAQLTFLGNEPLDEVGERSLNYLLSDVAIGIMTKWEVSPQRSGELLLQLELNIMDTEDAERIAAGK